MTLQFRDNLHFERMPGSPRGRSLISKCSVRTCSNEYAVCPYVGLRVGVVVARALYKKMKLHARMQMEKKFLANQQVTVTQRYLGPHISTFELQWYI